MITEDYVSFETAKLLKEKGFDEECYRFWEYEKANNKDDTNGISLSECNVYLPLCNSKIDYLFTDKLMSSGYSAPTLQMATKWLREVHHYYIQVMLDSWACGGHIGYYVVIQKTDSDFEIMLQDFVEVVFYQTYKEACEAAIKHCLENLI